MISIRELINRTNPLLAVEPGHWRGCCPICGEADDDKSLNVYESIQAWWCSSCGASGDAFSWLMQVGEMDFGAALQQLAAEAGVELTKRERRLPMTKEADPRIRVKRASEIDPSPEPAEHAYRRGYRDGWIVFYNTLCEAQQNGLPLKSFLEVAWDFWELGELYAWERAANSDEGMVLPPNCPTTR